MSKNTSPERPMSGAEMVADCKAFTMYSWSAGDHVDPIPVAGAEGAWLWTPEGERLLDFNSMSMSVNIGHGNPRVIAAMKAQLDTVAFVSPSMATEARARLGRLLSEITPGDIDRFFFTCSGAEANENAIKAARWVTGRHKILSRYRSYHGATAGAMQLTGDPRRLYAEPGPSGFVKVFDPEPYTYTFGRTDAEKTEANLRYLEEVITYEGPDHIAAMFVETVTGANGVLPPPAGYLQGLRDLLDRYGILLVLDEVMSGFGRTGKMFAFERAYDATGFMPDIVTMAKGLTSSYAPLGCMGMRPAVADHFRDNVFWGGLTYNAHPLSLAAADANIRALIDDGHIDNALRLEPLVLEEMAGLAARHPCVKAFRNVGLMGMVDLQKDAAGTPFSPYNAMTRPMKAFKRHLREVGVAAYVRWSNFGVMPPLCISEEDLRWGFARVDEALSVLDAEFND